MRLAITGTSGRVGSALVAALGTRHEVISLTRRQLDLADPLAVRKLLERLDFDCLINPAGLTGLEACEDDPALAWRLNADAPGEMAAICAARHAGFLHFSTDYVFAGQSPGLHAEADPAEPTGSYGRSKRAGETAVLHAHPQACILRISWVFGGAKPAFVDQIADAALAGRPLEAVADKFSLPTFTADLCEWVDALLRSRAEGIVHACNAGRPVSWHDIAGEVVSRLVKLGALTSAPPVRPLRLADVAALRAPRPRHTAMSCQRLFGYLNHSPRPWQHALADHLQIRLESH